MRQKDVYRIAGILSDEMRFAHESEVEGLRQAIGAIKWSVGWAQPELNMEPLTQAMSTPTLIAIQDRINQTHFYLREQPEHGFGSDESHIVRGED